MVLTFVWRCKTHCSSFVMSLEMLVLKLEKFVLSLEQSVPCLGGSCGAGLWGKGQSCILRLAVVVFMTFAGRWCFPARTAHPSFPRDSQHCNSTVFTEEFIHGRKPDPADSRHGVSGRAKVSWQYHSWALPRVWEKWETPQTEGLGMGC